MLFNSVDYLVLLVIASIVYWLVPKVWLRKTILVIASFAFYASWSGKYFLILAACVFLNWYCAKLFIERGKKIFLHAAVVGSLAILAFFKYTNFLIDSVWPAFSRLGFNQEAPRWDIVLPLGVSFYTFQLIAYTLDVARRKIEPEDNPADVGLFVLFFPHLIAGPICRAPQLLPQLKTLQKFSWATICDGCFFFLGGFFLKTGIADSLAPYINLVFSHPTKYSGLENTLATIAFGVQIYGDFCGYSLMALGSAKFFGINLPFNFDLPYGSVSLKEFWRKWHITLSNWLRDFLYIPLGGNRHGVWKTYRNLFLTMLLGGLWHGANWTFVAWGAIHGTGLAVNQYFSATRLGEKWNASKWTVIPSWILTMFVVLLAWIFFRSASIELSIKQIETIFKPNSGWSVSSLGWPFFEVLLLFIPTHLVVHHFTFKKKVSQIPIWQLCLLFVVFTYLSIAYYVEGKDFIYFQF